ncbi:hypothetical protein [Undibacterium sp. FT79W]|uniref:hypothetical protein n=1 Tax=Undibacterium sp. FT79W TaxID=2762296 RepID=UPI001C9ACC80|nr:hypothetical protein [Undibacterium sp. FT79W]
MNDIENSLKEKLENIDRLFINEEYDLALQICNEIIAENEDCYAAYSERSCIFHALGRNSEAFDDVDKLIKLRPTSPTAYMRRARWHLEQGADDLALKNVNFVIELGTEYFIDSAYFYQAIALLNIGKKTEAIEACQMLPGDFRDYVNTYNIRGKLLSRDDLYRLAQQGGRL